jgi:hypothetical protein
MADDDFKYNEVATGLPAETALDLAAVLSNFTPGLGGAVSNVLGGMGVGRKLDRVNEVLQGLADELRDVKSAASEKYVKTDEFEELLEKVLRKAADERSEQRRQLLKSFLVGAIVHPGGLYDKQRRVLRLLDDVEPDHMLVLRALSQPPTPAEMDGMMGPLLCESGLSQMAEGERSGAKTQTEAQKHAKRRGLGHGDLLDAAFYDQPDRERLDFLVAYVNEPAQTVLRFDVRVRGGCEIEQVWSARVKRRNEFPIGGGCDRATGADTESAKGITDNYPKDLETSRFHGEVILAA